MSSFTSIAYDKRVHRVAFPQRSPITLTLVDPEDYADLEALLDSTSLVESHRRGDRRIVEQDDDYVGNHREYVLAPFAYRVESRFSDGSFGVLYSAEHRETALKEVLSRLTRVYRDGDAPEQETRKQHLTLRVVADAIADVRKSVVPNIDRAIYDPENYKAARAMGCIVREKFPGLTYDSVRHEGGICLGVFIPRIISDVRLESTIAIVWSGSEFSEFKDIHPL